MLYETKTEGSKKWRIPKQRDMEERLASVWSAKKSFEKRKNLDFNLWKYFFES